MNPDSQFDADVDAFFDVPLAVDDRTRRIAAQLPKRFGDVVGRNDRLETIPLGRTRRRRFPLGWLLAAAAPVVVAAAGYFAIQKLQKPAQEVPIVAQPTPEETEDIDPVDPVQPDPKPTPAPTPEPAVVKTPKLQPKPIPTPMMATVPNDFFEEPWDEERISPDEPLPWSFAPIPKKVPLPRADDAKWSQTEIDQFVFAKYEGKGIRPVADASPEVLLRRITYDITGLPPTPKEVEEFIDQVGKQGRRQAIASLIEDLLGRPQFGEKWARFWLDLGGYDAGVKNAWRYREYVIAAFNNDKPFNHFLAEQIAGDLLAGHSPEHRQEARIATAFLAMGPVNPNEPDLEKFLMDQADRQVDLVTRTFLGLSVACARCHNHKFDPISKYDYYAMAGIFRSTETRNGFHHELDSDIREFVALDAKDAVQESIGMLEERERQDELKRLDKLVSSAESRLNRAQKDGDAKRIGRIAMSLRDLRVARNQVASTVPSKIKKSTFETIGVTDSRKPRDIELQIRGDIHNLGDVVERGFPDRLQLQNAPNEIPDDVSGRVELAKWLLADDQPLTSRVFVNRVWSQLMGSGIVSTVDDFGVNAADPSHPLLLDYLAREFMENGWSMKHLIREIMLSRVYQLDAVPSPKNLALDPENKLYWRRNIRQLTGEEIRDTLIFTAGVLTTESAAAQSTKRYFAAGEFGALSIFDDDEAEFPLSSSFRTIYLPIADNNPGMLAKFDCPEPGERTPQRMSTTNATQAMFMMNNEFVYQAAVEAAFPLAENERGLPDEALISQMFLSVLGRGPSEAELEWAQEFRAQFDPARDVTNVGPANVTPLQIGALGDAMNDKRFNFGGTHGPWTMLQHALYKTAEFRFLR
ncbi:MAG: DUF1549 and DUF1553 domain-containing protein [Verrucomicrobiota bacterium]